MLCLSALADEVAALARDARRIRLGDCCPERSYEQVDTLAHALEGLARRLRLGAPANDGAMPALVVTGRRQIIVAPGRSLRT